MDDTISPDSGADAMSENVELPVSIDTLSIDGAVPTIGDPVTLTVKGSVTRVVNKLAYVKPETVNDQPMQQALEPDPMLGEEERLRRLSETTRELPNGSY